MNRRVALRTGLLSGLGVTAAGAASSAGAQDGSQSDRAGYERLAREIAALGDTLQRQFEADTAHWRVPRQVMEQQRVFLKAAHRYPEVVEVGPAAWAALVEWHVRERQQLAVSRVADGRYTMAFNFSTILLRPDLDDNYVSPGYDGDRSAGRP
jgi:hypothetical protein